MAAEVAGMRVRLVAVAVVSAMTTGGCGGNGGGGGETKRTFVASHVFETHSRASRVAVGDVNGDGLMDMCVLEPDLSSVEVLVSTALRESPTLLSQQKPPKFARGGDAYRSTEHVLVWDTTADVALADLDGDGRPDLIVAGGGTLACAIYPGDPENPGRFQAPVVRNFGMSCDRVAVGDVNGDGKPDLVCLDESLGRLRPAYQTGPLAFTVDTSPPDIGACFGLVVADVDRDGKVDCVTNRPDADVVTLFTWSTGVLAPRDVATGQASGRCMAVGDVDGDGWLDVCVLAEGGAQVSLLHQNPAQPGAFTFELSPLGIAIKEQGVKVCVPAVQRRGVVQGCGGGNYRAIDDAGHETMGIAIDEPGVHVAGLTIGQPGLALADCDGDGVLDVCGIAVDSGDVEIAFGFRESPTRRSGFERAVAGGVPDPTPAEMCVCADLDADGRIDFLTCDDASSQVNPLYTDNSFVEANPVFTGTPEQRAFTISTVLSADVDLDGLPDLVFGVSDCIQVQFQDTAAPGTFLPPLVLAPGTSWTRVAVGDVNGDGAPDVVGCTAGGLCRTFLRGLLERREFPLAFDVPAGPAAKGPFALADVDRDGNLDIVQAYPSLGLGDLFHGVGDGTFTSASDLFPAPIGTSDVAVADLDGDGSLDVAMIGVNSVMVQMRSSSFAAGPRQTLPLMRGGVRVAVGDLDGDGRCDLCTSGDHGVQCALQSPVERGTFVPSHVLDASPAGGLSIGDFDGDGRLDLCFCRLATGECVCIEGDPADDSPPSLRLNGLPPGEPVIGTLTFTCDIDDDGDLDLVTSAPTLGSTGSTFAIWPHMHK
jgi:hypothetical protein